MPYKGIAPKDPIILPLKERSLVVVIKFADPETDREALGFLLGRFSGRVLRTGEVIVPETALEALAEENFSFTVLGKATYEQMAAFRGAPSAPVQ